MATKAFQKIYTKITQITKATCSLKASGVGYDELASVDGKLAQVVKIVPGRRGGVVGETGDRGAGQMICPHGLHILSCILQTKPKTVRPCTEKQGMCGPGPTAKIRQEDPFEQVPDAPPQAAAASDG